MEFPPGSVVSVVVDRQARLGELSYRVPQGLPVSAGDAVGVPFGRRSAVGVVVGPGDEALATREIGEVFGSRTSAEGLAVCAELAARHMCSVADVVQRLAPPHGRSADPIDAGPVVLAGSPVPVATRSEPGGRYVLRAPLVSPAAVAASVTASAARNGQVLVLCPTKALVTAVVSAFSSGAARLDAAMDRGAWSGFAAGTVRVGVGTRAAALYQAADLAAVVVVEEDHPGHREPRSPHINVRDVAAARARCGSAQLIVTGAAPTAAGLGAGVKLVTAGTKRDWPAVHIVDRGEVPPTERLVPPFVHACLAKAKRSGKRVIVVGPRRPARTACPRCRAPVTAPACARCKLSVRESWDVDHVAGLVDADNAYDHFEVFRAVGRARSSSASVLVVGLDVLRSQPSLSPAGDLARHLSVAASLAGRGGELWLPTMTPTDPCVAAIGRGDQLALARLTWDEARRANLPPFRVKVSVSIKARSTPDVSGWPGITYGPTRRGDEWEVVVLCDASDLAVLAVSLEHLSTIAKCRFEVT